MDALPGLLSSLLATAIAIAAQSAPSAKGPAKAAAPAPDESAFSKSFAALQKLGDSGKWSDEKKGLIKLLNETGDQPFVQARRTEIVDELRRAAIRTAVPQPDPATMTAGKLLAWDRHSGDLSISYAAGQWGDFKPEGRLFIHPVVFDGPVTIKLGGDDFSFAGSDLLQILIGIHDDEATDVAIGARKDLGGDRFVPAVCEIVQNVGKSKTKLATAPRAPNYGKPFEIEIVVGTTEIAVNGGGSRLAEAKLPKGFRGFVALNDTSRVKHLSMRGHATPSWLQGKLDAATHDAEAAFLKKWKIEDDLPPWLRDGANGTTAAGVAGDAAAAKGRKVADAAKLPWPMSEAQAKLYQSLAADLADGHPEQTLLGLRRIKSGDLPRDVAEYLTLETLERVGGLSVAAELLDAFIARNPGFLEGHYLHARLQVDRVALDDAARELSALRGKYDDPGRLAVDLVEVELLRGQPEEAQRVLREARAAGASSPEFDELDRTVVHVLRGPDFTRRFEQKSPHFTLATDIDNDTARASLKNLEESYAICAKVFGASDAPARPFPVYFFSGQTSYAEYAGAKSKMAHSTAGMYSPLYKHLMVWNLPERVDVAKTLRHEATHQYLDLLGYRVPVWFNEGLAVYVEFIASSSKADLKGGAVDRAYVERLFKRESPLIPIKQFISIGRSDFYDHAAITYPEAWALVHFLRHGDAPSKPTNEDPAPQEVNARLMAGLQQRLAPHDVVRSAFDGVDLVRFEERFVDHITGLRSQVEKK